MPAGGVHQLAGVSGGLAGELPVALDDVAADDDGLDVGRPGAERCQTRAPPIVASRSMSRWCRSTVGAIVSAEMPRLRAAPVEG